jgi:mannitol/fructose-specific phosphotransferase system IIA component (Ntr-type)
LAGPNARIDGLPESFVEIGFSIDGIDFDAPDGKPAQIMLMVLSPINEETVQLERIASFARTSQHMILY